MKLIKQVLFTFTSFVLAVTPLLMNTSPVSANSYFGGNGRIVFYSPVADNDSTQEIYTVRPNGTELKRITSNNTQDSNPQWAPSGDKIAYDHYVDSTNQRDIYIQNINPDGSANGSPTVLTGANTVENEWDPSWSPDGTKIAFHRRADTTGNGTGPNHIQVIASNGTGSVVSVTSNDAFRETEPTWNKDGTQLAFTRFEISSSTTSIVTAAPTASATLTTVDTGVVGSPQWSPVGNKVVYAKSNNLWLYDKDADDADGTGPSDNIIQLTTFATITDAPTWSPDGSMIVASNGGTMRYYSALNGNVVANHTVATNVGLNFASSANANELDWARAAAPPSTEHECTTYVNEDCTEFTPEIPAECQYITAAAENGTPKYENGAFIYTPNEGYVGNDTYIYQYYDSNMNPISCTINIIVLPHPPETGSVKKIQPVLYGALGLMGVGLLLGARNKYSKR